MVQPHFVVKGPEANYMVVSALRARLFGAISVNGVQRALGDHVRRVSWDLVQGVGEA